MTKIFTQESILRINDDLTVIVDKDAEIKEDNYRTHLSQDDEGNEETVIVKHRNNISDAMCSQSKKVIATIGTKRLEGIAVIELNDEVEYLALNYAESQDKKEQYYRRVGFIAGYKASQSKGAYAKEDMHKCWIQSTKKGFDPLTESGFTAFIQSLKQSKEIVELTLEYEKKARCFCPTASDTIHSPNRYKCNGYKEIQELKIHNKESNGIIPVSVKYSS